MKIHCEYTKLIPISELKGMFHEKNCNNHPREQIERLAKILEYQGVRYTVNVSKRSGKIVSGHGRVLAAEMLGWEEFPVSLQDFESDEQEYAAIVADNSIASWAELDLSAINLEVPNLGPDFDIDLLGIKDFVIEPVDKYDPQSEEDSIPEKVETRCKPGDLWQLGQHRLLCGDSTNMSDLEKLMGEERASLWLTDPPYGVAYQSKNHDPIANDALPLEEMADFWTTVASNAHLFCADKSAYYWFACQGGNQMMMMMSISRANWKVRHELIWVKDQLVLSRCDYHYKHEPILYGWKQDGTHEWFGDRKQTSVLEFPRPKKSEQHPTMKPVALVEYLLNNSTKAGQIVLDTFGGSGTTLIAAEKSNRKARLIELSPKYCDVILSRFEEHTGKQAALIN